MTRQIAMGVISVLISCNSDPRHENTLDIGAPVLEVASVKTTISQLTEFDHLIVGNGKIVPNRYERVHADIDGIVLVCNAMNGKSVKKDNLEPSDKNLESYSYRIHELFVRTCIEVEANCKAILNENGYTKKGELNMNDYKKIDVSHRLSSYGIGFPQWSGAKQMRQPFKNWADRGALSWYSSYNAVKHDRSSQFEQASFDNLLCFSRVVNAINKRWPAAIN